MIFNKIQEMEITARFRLYPHVVCGADKILYQLDHFKNRRTCYFKKLTYNPERKAYRINSQWVTKKTLYRLIK